MNEIIRLGNASLELAYDGERFAGIGAVTIGGLPMRDPQRRWFADIRTPDAVRLVNYRLTSTEKAGAGWVLRFEAARQNDGMMEWMLHTVRNRQNVADWSDPPTPAEDTELALHLQAVERQFGEETFTGFSYQFRYSSRDLPIYKIVDRGTWEPGGRIVGSEFWLRSGSTNAIRAFESLEDRYSTEWYLPPIEQPNIFQFFPLQGALNGFTYTAAPDGVLLTMPTEVAHIRSLFEKHAGKDALFHWHEHCADLRGELATSPVEVLWRPGSSDRIGHFNRWEAIRRWLWKELHQQIGMEEERVEPYGVLEEWGIPDLDRYTSDGVTKLAEYGIKTYMIPSEHANNMNVYGASNMCCVTDWRVAESVGEDRLTAFCSAVKSKGGWVEMWGNTALSALQFNLDINPWNGNAPGRSAVLTYPAREGTVWPELAKASRPWVRNGSGAIEADHYSPVFCQVNLADLDVRNLWLTRWRDLRDRIGVDGIFVDSSFNMSMDKFTHAQNADHGQSGGATIDQTGHLGQSRPAQPAAAEIVSQYRPYLDTLTDMQGGGHRISVEDIGVWGVSRSGPDLKMRLDSLPLWVDSLCVFDPSADDADEVFFRGLAYRNMWYLYWRPADGVVSFHQDSALPEHRPRPWHGSMLRAYSLALPRMDVRYVHPDQAMIEYRRESDRVLWVVRECELPLGEWENALDGSLVKGSAPELSVLLSR